jgi:predicted enzyme related to lactoylglutathione lyase
MAKATKKAAKRPAAKKAAPKKSKKAAAAKAAPRKAAKKPAKKAPAAKARRAATAAPNVDGWITHTEFASADPAATEAWATKVLGWKAMPPMPTPDGPYHMFQYSQMGGGGIRRLGPTERPSAVPYVSVPNCQAAYDKALKAGAESVSAPMKVQDGLNIATVKAPGGVLIGLAGR